MAEVAGARSRLFYGSLGLARNSIAVPEAYFYRIIIRTIFGLSWRRNVSRRKNEAMQLDCTEIGMVMTVVKTSQDTGGKSLEMEWTLSPNSGGTPIHIHPAAIETYEILNGSLEVFKKDKWITANVGEKIIIEKGEPHTFKNTTDKFVKVYNTHQPAMEFENFFRGLHKFANSGLVKNGQMNFKSLIAISTLWTNYSKEIVSVNPPPLVMKALGAVGRLIGINFK